MKKTNKHCLLIYFHMDSIEKYEKSSMISEDSGENIQKIQM